MMRVVLLMVCSLLLVSACASKKSGSAASADATKTKQKASQKPYTVMGKRYEPLKSHEGFVQTGVASWYGKDFHGKLTSNGEKYDMHSMTAAHKTLPLGVYVRVSNTDNGHEAIVRVNDRGPFVKGRIIDLSYSAARKLGVDIVGTAPVRVEALGYRVPGSDGFKAAVNYDAGNYTVQIGSFKDQKNAERLSNEMNKLFGFSESRLTTVNGEIFYRVYSGKYSSLTAAEAAERDFIEHGYPGSFVVALE